MKIRVEREKDSPPVTQQLIVQEYLSIYHQPAFVWVVKMEGSVRQVYAPWFCLITTKIWSDGH